MSNKTIECHIVVCDGCGEGMTNQSGYVCHWENTGDIERDDEWAQFDEKDYCEGCREIVAHKHRFDDGYCEMCRIDEEDVTVELSPTGDSA